MKQDSPGFSLLELVVAAAIITTVIAWSIPNYMRTVKQGEVDRYNRAIESGFQNLQESLRSTRTTTLFQFNSPNEWRRPDQVLEFRQSTERDENGNPVLDSQGRAIIEINAPERLRACNSELNEQTGEECPNIETIRKNVNTSDAMKSLRFMVKQFTPDSERVQVAVSTSNFTMTPPGSNAETEPLTFVVRSIDAERDPSLKARCMRVTGSGVLKRGTWQGELANGSCDFGDK